MDIVIHRKQNYDHETDSYIDIFELLLLGKDERKEQLVSVAEIDMQNELTLFED